MKTLVDAGRRISPPFLVHCPDVDSCYHLSGKPLASSIAWRGTACFVAGTLGDRLRPAARVGNTGMTKVRLPPLS